MTISQWAVLKIRAKKFITRGNGNRDKFNEMLTKFKVRAMIELEPEDRDAFAKEFYALAPEYETTKVLTPINALDQREADDKAKAYRERVRAIAIPVLASMQAIPSHGDDPRLDVDRAIKLAVLLDTEINKL